MKKDYEYIDEYLHGELAEEELAMIKQRINNDPAFAAEVEEYRILLLAILTKEDYADLKKLIDSKEKERDITEFQVRNIVSENEIKILNRKINFAKKIAILAFSLFFFVFLFIFFSSNWSSTGVKIYFIVLYITLLLGGSIYYNLTSKLQIKPFSLRGGDPIIQQNLKKEKKKSPLLDYLLLVSAIVLIPFLYLFFLKEDAFLNSQRNALFFKVTLIFLLLSILFAFVRRKYLNSPLRILLSYCIIVALLHSIRNFLLLENYNLYTNVFHLFNFLDQFVYLLMVGWFYFLIFPIKYRSWVGWFSILVLIASSMNFIFVKDYQNYIYSTIAAMIFTFFTSSFYLWYLYKSHLNFPFYTNSYFWFSISLFVVSIGTALLYLFLYFLIAKDSVISGFLIESHLLFLLYKFEIFYNIIGQVTVSFTFWYAPYLKNTEQRTIQ